jgi:hypothetical protein
MRRPSVLPRDQHVASADRDVCMTERATHGLPSRTRKPRAKTRLTRQVTGTYACSVRQFVRAKSLQAAELCLREGSINCATGRT